MAGELRQPGRNQNTGWAGDTQVVSSRCRRFTQLQAAGIEFCHDFHLTGLDDHGLQNRVRAVTCIFDIVFLLGLFYVLNILPVGSVGFYSTRPLARGLSHQRFSPLRFVFYTTGKRFA